jgi:exonuclease III
MRERTLHHASFNSNDHLIDPDFCRDLMNYIKTLNLDILAIQETHTLLSDENKIIDLLKPHRIFFNSDYTSRVHGACIIINRRHANGIITHKSSTVQGRAILISCNLYDRPITIINVYLSIRP